MKTRHDIARSNLSSKLFLFFLQQRRDLHDEGSKEPKLLCEPIFTIFSGSTKPMASIVPKEVTGVKKAQFKVV